MIFEFYLACAKDLNLSPTISLALFGDLLNYSGKSEANVITLVLETRRLRLGKVT